jgi:16S rRNA processing protein RimM
MAKSDHPFIVHRSSMDWEHMVLVGRIARPHGVRGQVIVNPETDFVDDRFVSGATMWARSAQGEEALTISSARVQNGRPVIGFEGFSSIDEVERLAGLELRVPEEALQQLGEGVYYQHQLVGCAVETVGGARIGEVSRVDGGAGGSLLAVRGTRGEVLIPFAQHICVDVDVAGRRIRIDPPDGLLELNEKGSGVIFRGRREK